MNILWSIICFQSSSRHCLLFDLRQNGEGSLFPLFFPNNKKKNQDSERIFDLSNVGLKPRTSANSDTPQYSFLDQRPK